MVDTKASKKIATRRKSASKSDPQKVRQNSAQGGGLSYRDAGVSIDAGDAFVERLAKNNPAIGGFAGAFPLKTKGMKKPHLLAATDGVGTKLLLAQKLKKLDTVGVDLVAMCVNDLVVTGGAPLFFLDYYATGKLNDAEADAILKGIAAGCEMAGIPLLGGETAEMPGAYKPGEFDLAGFSVGIVDAAKIIDGSRVKPGDAIIGIASSGVHSNGYSLVRAIVAKKRLALGRKLAALKTADGVERTLGETLLEPTRIYVKPVLKVTEKIAPTAMAHITGGGLSGNLVRVLPNGVRAEIVPASWEAPAIFRLLQEKGGVADEEMERVFNMGVGFVIVCRESDAKKCLKILQKAGEQACRIGTIQKGQRGVSYKTSAEA